MNRLPRGTGQPTSRAGRPLVGRAILTFLVLSVVVAAIALAAGGASLATLVAAVSSPSAALADPLVDESSGLAASRTMPGLLWTINDSGDAPMLYLTDETGAALGRWLVDAAENRDWEDVAATTSDAGDGLLVVADSGVHGEFGIANVLYVVAEPIVDRDSIPSERSTPTLPAAALPFAYPDGQRDAEALLVHPLTGETLLVTKGADGAAEAYRFPGGVLAAAVPGAATNTVQLERVGEVDVPGLGPLAFVTGGAVSPDARRLALIAYGGVWEWNLAEGETLAAALAKAPSRVPAPLLGQQEAVTYSAAGDRLFTTAEGSPAPLASVAVDRSTRADGPSAAAPGG